jgi:hypothetical protein
MATMVAPPMAKPTGTPTISIANKTTNNTAVLIIHPSFFGADFRTACFKDLTDLRTDAQET